MKVSSPGFASQINTGVEINVQSRPSIDFNLKIGEVSNTVDVGSSTPILQTETANVGGVISGQQIVDLPLNGRRYSDLALLRSRRPKNLTNQNNQAPDRFSVNGNLETQNYFSLDGVDNNSGSTNLQRVRSSRAASSGRAGGVSRTDAHVLGGVWNFSRRRDQCFD